MGEGQKEGSDYLLMPLQPPLLPSSHQSFYREVPWMPGSNPPLQHTGSTHHIFPPCSHGWNTRLPCILIFLSSHWDITAAPSECRWWQNPTPQQDECTLTAWLLEQFQGCLEPLPWAPSGAEKMKARTSEDLRQVWKKVKQLAWNQLSNFSALCTLLLWNYDSGRCWERENWIWPWGLKQEDVSEFKW